MAEQWWHGYVYVWTEQQLVGDQVALVRAAFQQLADSNATDPQFMYRPKMNLAGTAWVIEAKWNMGAIITLTPQGIIGGIQSGIEDSIGQNLGVNLWDIAATEFFGLNDANGVRIQASGIVGERDNFMTEIAAALARDSSWQGSRDAADAFIQANIQAWE